MKKIIVKQDEERPVPVEVLAESIKAISDAIKKLRSGPIKDGALILLIQHASKPVGDRHNKHKVSAKEVRTVLDAIQSLEKEYLKNPLEKLYV